MGKPCVVLAAMLLAGCSRERAVVPKVAAVRHPAAVLWARPIELADVDILRLMPDERVLVGAMRRDGEETTPRELWLLDRATGEVIWRGKRPASGSHAVVGEAAGKVIIKVTRETRVTFLAIALDSGVTLWEHEEQGTPAAALDSSATRLIIAGDQRVRAIACDAGTTLWETAVAVHDAVISDAADVVCVAGIEIACLKATTGALLWRKPAGDNQRVVFARVLGNTLLAGSDAGLSTWNTGHGGSRWWRSIPGKHLVSVAIAGDLAYAVSSDGNARTARLSAVALQSGEIRWTSEKLPIPSGPISALADNIYVPTPAVLFALDAASGVRAARAPMPRELIRNRRDDLLLVDDATVTVLTHDGAATFQRDSLEPTRSTTFTDARNWGGTRTLTPNGKTLVGFQAGVGVMSYAVERAPETVAEPAIVVEVREGRTTSLRQGRSLPACYGTDMTTDLPYDAIETAAVLGNNRAILRELEAEGARNLVSVGGVEYGDIATALGFTEVADELSGRGQRITIGTELTLAIAHDDVASAKALLERGARPNGASAFNTKRSCYPVPLAASRSVAMSELLLAKGAVVNLIDGKGRTPLDERAAARDQTNVTFLRSRGAKTAAELKR